MNSFNEEKNQILSRRTFFIILINILSFALIVGRLYYLQIFQADKYRTMSDENRISTRFLIPPRGMIFDRNGEVIAKNEQNFQALLIAEQTPDIAATIKTFKEIIPLSKDEEEHLLKEIKGRRRFIPIKFFQT